MKMTWKFAPWGQIGRKLHVYDYHHETTQAGGGDPAVRPGAAVRRQPAGRPRPGHRRGGEELHQMGGFQRPLRGAGQGAEAGRRLPRDGRPPQLGGAAGLSGGQKRRGIQTVQGQPARRGRRPLYRHGLDMLASLAKTRDDCTLAVVSRYGAVLDGLVGEYEIEVADETAEGGKKWVRKYGLKGFSPIAKNYPYSDFDDFGTSRDYGFKRKHLGHDFMGATGTPIIAVEGGTVEALGWNQYGGWRIGIRSHDKKRYYYYAHLRQNFPFNKSLEVGSVVQPGDVIGYLGHTGYSTKENVNNIKQPHLHFGLQLIFDESQKEGNNEIWVDVYPLVRLLYRNRCEVVKDQETKEYSRVYGYRECTAEGTA